MGKLLKFIEISFASEKVRQFNEKYLLDTYRISRIQAGHWSVEHAKREYNIRPVDTLAREGRGVLSKKRVQLLSCFRYADLSLSGEEKRQRERHGDWSCDFLCCLS